MADVATPSGAAMFDAGGAEKKKPEKLEKPEKPDEDAYKAALKKAEKDHADAMAKFNAVRAKLDIAQPKNKDSPSAKRRSELLAELKEIREQQAGGKAGRNKIFEEIKRLDEKLKSKIAEQKTARSRVSFKNVDEIDREIDRLDKQVNGGMMKLVDEKKALAEISSLRKQRKGFAGFEQSQKEIDDLKAELKAKRDTLDDPESKALSDKYSKLQTELDAIKSEQDDAFKNIQTLRDQRTKLQAEQQEKYLAIKKIKDDYYNQGRAVQKYEYEARQKQRERRKLELETFEKEKKKERAQKLLAEASDKAYLDEIRRAESLLRFLDPSYQAERHLSSPVSIPGPGSAYRGRCGPQGSESRPKGGQGRRLLRGHRREEGQEGSKGCTGWRFRGINASRFSQIQLPAVSREDCAFMSIDPPMSAADIPDVREKVKAKLDFWKADQDAQTERNIAKAKKELERLEAEDSPSASSPTVTPASHVNGNGETKATVSVAEGGSVTNEVELVKGAVADIVADVKGASLDDMK